MAEETSNPGLHSEDEPESQHQTPVPVIEIPDSSNEGEEDCRPAARMEEKSFISGLHSYMRVRGTPIERIPHLGFKQINLWRIYKAVEKLGGYDSVTTNRLWKRVYDELGGSPGSTSAATCTRKHYERLVLPFERHIRGEEDKPLPPTKPRKPYKRNADVRVDKCEGKKKKVTDSKLFMQSGDLVLRPLPSLWTVPSDQLDRSKSNTHPNVYELPHVLPVSCPPWTPPVAVGAGVGNSPLEKKKRMAQASLNLQLSPHGTRSQQSSVTPCPSPGPESSDGSPQPESSSSSTCSPSPLSVSSEDTAVNQQDRPLSRQTLNNSKCLRADNRMSPESPEATKDKTNTNCKPEAKDSAKDTLTNWSPVYKRAHLTPLQKSSFPVKHDLAPPSTSSFTKVVPKTVQLFRPAPIRLGYKIHQMCQVQNDSIAKKLSGTSPRFCHTAQWERLSKVPIPQHSQVHNLPPSPVGYRGNKSGQDIRFHSFHPALLQNRLGVPHAQMMYHPVPVSTGHPAVFGPLAYPYAYAKSPPGYPHIMPVYPHKL